MPSDSLVERMRVQGAWTTRCCSAKAPMRRGVKRGSRGEREPMVSTVSVDYVMSISELIDERVHTLGLWQSNLSLSASQCCSFVLSAANSNREEPYIMTVHHCWIVLDRYTAYKGWGCAHEWPQQAQGWGLLHLTTISTPQLSEAYPNSSHRI
jgi:hypothetical protein